MNDNTDINVNYSTFGSRLKKARRDKGLTQNGLSDKIGICRDTLVKWERDAASPDLKLVVELCKILDCDIGYFVGEYDTKKRVSDDLCSLTGLSEGAAKKLSELSKEEKSYLDDLLTRESFFMEISAHYSSYLQGMITSKQEYDLYLSDNDPFKSLLTLTEIDGEEIKMPVMSIDMNQFLSQIFSNSAKASMISYQTACINFLQAREKEETR